MKSHKISSYGEILVQNLLRNGQTATAKHYKSCLSRINEFDGQLTFERLTHNTAESFYMWLLHRRKVGHNTARFYVRTLQAIYNKAVNYGLIKDAQPFAKIPTATLPTRHRALSREQLVRLFNLQADVPVLKEALDMFKLSFFLHGAAPR